MYADYCKDMYNRDVLVEEHGFVVYQKFEDNSLYIHALYVDRDKRGDGYSLYLEEKLIEKETPDVCFCYVDLTTKNPTLSLKLILLGGYEIYESSSQTVSLKKDYRGQYGKQTRR